MVDSADSPAQGRYIIPLMGRFCNVDTEEEMSLNFVITDRIDESCVAAIQSLMVQSDDAAFIVLYAHPDPQQEALAFEAGACDCIHTAFNFRYLSARLRAIATRQPHTSLPAP